MRGITRDDLDLSKNYFQWFNDAEVMRYMYRGLMPNTEESMGAFYQSISRSATDAVFAIVVKDGDVHIGNTGLHHIDWVNRRAEFGIIIGEKDCWGRGYGSEAAALMVEYGFRRLNLHRIYLGVHAEHAAGVRAYEKAGFTVEGRLRDEFFRDGRYADRLIMGIVRGEWEAARADRAAQAASAGGAG